jgi:glycosyltransferase involved in cell wall biosynthesis
MKISVLTPTYNRAHTLNNLYQSLINNQKYCNDFEWLIMDDGSTDNTKELIGNWSKENKINIKYYYQKNQGKMVALNNLLKHISGELTIECDSDDYFTNDCFKYVLAKYKEIENNDNIYGMAFNRINSKKEVIGSKFIEEGMVAKIFDIYFKYQITGDKCLIFKSAIRKKYKHKLENKERFATEGRMYHEMDLKYQGIKCYNIKGVVCEYLDDGYTKNILNIFKKYPYGHYYYYLEMFNFNLNKIPMNQRIHIIKHYILFSYLLKKSKLETIKKVKGIINKLLLTILIIPGYILTKKKFK